MHDMHDMHDTQLTEAQLAVSHISGSLKQHTGEQQHDC